jgi:adenylate cyclase
MATQEIKRKLTAILSADVKGYGRLMGEDEKGTVRTLNAYKEVLTDLIRHHDGRVVDAPGDNLLAEFASVVDAVECAVEIQKELKTQNAELPENRRMEFRIGVNLGDVIEEEGRIFGDGVNIAARLESLSEGGGICISGTAFDQVKNKLPLGYQFLGEQTVKNTSEPVRVYQILLEPEAAGKVIGEKKAKLKQWQRAAFAVIAILIVVVAAVVIWKLYTPSAPQPEVASKEKMVHPLPDVPSIAVLPFVNMSGDPKQEFFSDGITEDIITALSKVPMLFVIARNSTFTYKGKPVKVKQISEELGVQYILEGSVQRSDNRVRITAQLIDALSGHHIWAERYDRDLKDIFALQDEVTRNILTAMQVKITEGEQALHRDRGMRNLNCYLKYLEGKNYSNRFDIEGNNLARRVGEEVLVMCPESSSVYQLLAITHMMDYWLGSGKSPQESIEKAIELARKAIALDDAHAHPHGLLSFLYSIERKYEKALAEGERAVALDPNGADVYAWYAMSLTFAERPEEAIPLFQKAIRLNPFGPAWYFFNLGSALLNTGRSEEAVSAFKKSLQRSPDNLLAHVLLATTYSMMGREKEARAEAAEVLRINPKFSLDYFAKALPFKDQKVTNNVIKALRKAGLK